MSKDEEQWIDEVLNDLAMKANNYGLGNSNYPSTDVAQAKATIKAKLVESRIEEVERFNNSLTIYSNFETMKMFVNSRLRELQGLGEQHEQI